MYHLPVHWGHTTWSFFAVGSLSLPLADPEAETGAETDTEVDAADEVALEAFVRMASQGRRDASPSCQPRSTRPEAPTCNVCASILPAAMRGSQPDAMVCRVYACHTARYQ